MLKSIQIGNSKFIIDENITVECKEDLDFFIIEEQDKLTDDFYKNRDIFLEARKKKYDKDKPDQITELTVYFTRKCPGDCPYCHQGSNTLKDGNELSFEMLIASIKRIEEIAPISDEVYIRLTGGDIFLTKDHDAIVGYLINRFPKSSIKLFLSLLNSQEDYDYHVKPMLEGLIDHDLLLEFTFDIGVDDPYTRTSSKYGVNKAELLFRITELIDVYYDKYHIDIKSLISSFTKPDLFKQEFDTLYEKFKDKAVFLFNIAKDKKFNPTNETVNEVIDFFMSEYFNLCFPVMGKKIGIGEIEYDTILKDHYCQAYISTAMIRDDGTIGNCFVNYQKDPNWYSLNKSKDKDLFNNLIPECHECNLVFTCNRCIYRRKVYPCSKHPFFKTWEKFLLILKVMYDYKLKKFNFN